MTDKYPAYVPPVAVWNTQTEQQNKDQEQQQEQENPKGDPPKKNTESEQDDEELGTGGTKALAAERARANAAEKELKKLKDAETERQRNEMSEVDRLKQDNTGKDEKLTSLEKENMKLRIGLELKMDPSLVKRLQGDTEDEIRADAEELVKLAPPANGPKIPKADPSQGRKKSTGGLSPKDEFTDTLDGLFDRGN